GVEPEIKLAKEANLEIGKLGGIAVNSQLQTSDNDIYALGDATEIIDIVSNNPALIPLANSANKQARIVADNIHGSFKKYLGTSGTAIAKVFDLTIAITGNSEKQLKRQKFGYDKVYLQPVSHAGYYPNAYPMIIKLLFNNRSGRILGAQIVGIEGVDKRIDVIAALIQTKQTVQELASLELAYAPPFSSAKDPVNLAGMIAINQMEGKNPSVFWHDVANLIQEKAIFIDVRTKMEFELGHIEGAINIPLTEIRDNLEKIKQFQNSKIIVYCNQGKIAYFALAILLNHNLKNVFNLNGGYKIYHSTTLNQENTDVFNNEIIDKKDDINIGLTQGDKIIKIDACGLQCPGPIMKLNQAIIDSNVGDIIELETTDYGFKNDVGVWCERTNNLLLSVEDRDKKIIAKIQKGNKLEEFTKTVTNIPHDKTIVVFSNNLDKAIAAFIIANGASAMNRKVTLFFTFWGLNILRKAQKPTVKKTFLETMFTKMMPQGSEKLILSQMNMFGFGPKMIKHIMKTKNVDSLEILIKHALDSGVKLIACQMSMDLIGIKKEELIDGVEISGVASYLGAAEMADTNLFV
ncbi:MAG: DsrE/DsrF/DrsH-like family protein, partial [Candidatus Margulisiibacteriota bacterium]